MLVEHCGTSTTFPPILIVHRTVRIWDCDSVKLELRQFCYWLLVINSKISLMLRSTKPSLKRRRGVSNHRQGYACLLVVVLVVVLALIWVFLISAFYLSLQNDKVNYNGPTGRKSGQIPAAVIPTQIHPVLNAGPSRHHDLVDRNDKATIRKPHQVPSEVEPRGLSNRASSFPPKFPVVTRNHSLSEEILAMCENTLWHTLKTTTIVLPDGDTFIHTGDIDDLWLRDSAAQIHPLLVPFGAQTAAEEKMGIQNTNPRARQSSLVASDPRLARVVSGLIKRTAMYIRHDPYANAFRIDDSYVFSAEQKLLGRHDLISTWNYELDSACYYMRMLYYFYKALPDHPVLRLQSVKEAIQIMLDVWISEQDHEGDAYPTGPLLDCQNCGKPYRYPSLPRGGKGTEVAETGMTWTGFRPSDDECKYGYLVPANMFAVVVLGYVQEMAPILWNDMDMAEKAKRLATEIDQGIQQHAIVEHPVHGKIYAYEVDGLGNHLLMDDANVPSLMSIPYLGYNYDPDIYARTRRFILSSDNPTYRRGHNRDTGDIEGYGSPHMSQRIPENIWPMSIAVQALTSSNLDEKLRLLDVLAKTTGGTGWMHESFDANIPAQFTRAWFCWADSLFAELVMTLTDLCPRGNYKVMTWKDPVQVPGGKYAA